MADRIKGITIELDGDTTKLSKSLSSVNSEIRSTQSELKDVEKLLKLDPGNVDLLKQKQQYLTDAIDETSRKLEAEKAALKQLKDSADGTEANTKATQALTREIVDTENKLKNLKKEAKEFGSVFQQQMQAAGKEVAKVGEKITKVGEGITGVGTSLVPVTAAVTGLATAAVTTAANFEQGMAKVQAISGATDEELERLSEIAREMGATTKFSATEAAEALTYMAMAGWKTEDMISGLPGVMNLAAASGEDLATVSDIVTDAMTAFGYEISEGNVAHFVDVLASAANNANTNVTMLGESFKYVAPVAGALGYSVDDVAVALGIMANSGIKASQAGTTLRTLLSNLAKPTEQMEVAMERLGISLTNADGTMKSLDELMQSLRVSFGNCTMPAEELRESIALLDDQLDNGQITEEEYSQALEALTEQAYGAEGALKAKYAATIAGQRGMAGLLSLVNTSEEDFGKLTTAIDEAAGTAQKMADIMNDTTQGSLTMLKSELESVAIEFGNILLPVVKEVIDWIKQLAEKVNNLTDEQKETIVQIAAVVAAISPLLIIIGTLTSTIGKVTTAVGNVMSVFGKVPTKSQLIIAAIAAIVAAGVLIYENWDTIKAKCQELWEKVKDFFEKIGNKISDIWTKVTDAGKNAWNAVTDVIGKIKNGFFDVIDGAKNWGKDLIDNFVGGITSMIGKVKDSVRNVANTVKDFLGFSEPKEGPLSNFHTFMPDMIKLMSEGLEQGAKDLKNPLTALAQSISPEQKVTVDYSSTGITNRLDNIAGKLGQTQPVNVTVTMAPQAKGIMKVVQKEVRMQTKATGINPLLG